jgi:phage shock protein A
MERLGITTEMLEAAQDCGLALQQSTEGVEATKASLETHQSLARRIDRDAEELYTKAKEFMTQGDEDTARSYLLKRTDEQERLKKVLKLCVEEKKRLTTMESNVEAIQRRALEVESLLQRTVGAKARQDIDLSLPVEDPLLKKFRDLGID